MIKIDIGVGIRQQIAKEHYLACSQIALEKLRELADQELSNPSKEFIELLKVEFRNVIIGDPNFLKKLIENWLAIDECARTELRDDLSTVFCYEKLVKGFNVTPTSLGFFADVVSAIANTNGVHLNSTNQKSEYVSRVVQSIETADEFVEEFGLQEEVLVAKDWLLRYRKCVEVGNTVGVKAETKRKIQEIFNKRTWGAYELVSKLAVGVCPYCNRNYISVLRVEDKGKTRPALDHFYPKSKYPFLALSLCNLVPSCHICNSHMKGEFDPFEQEAMNPFDEGFENEVFFTLQSTDCSINYLLNEGDEFEIDFVDGDKINDSVRKRARTNIAKFRLQELYDDNHKDYVQEFIQKAKIYTPSYIEELLSLSTIFDDENEVWRFVLGNYFKSEEYNKRPLSKFTHDICKELGLSPE